MGSISQTELGLIPLTALTLVINLGKLTGIGMLLSFSIVRMLYLRLSRSAFNYSYSRLNIA
jgi:hypothetical protein